MRRVEIPPAPLALGLSGAAMAASDGAPGPTRTGDFQVSMTVVGAPGAPSNRISELDDFALGLVTSDLTIDGIATFEWFCLTRSGTGALSPRITFSQPGVSTLNIDIGSNFALVGPARAGKASGFAQAPFEVLFAGGGNGQWAQVMSREVAHTGPIPTGETCDAAVPTGPILQIYWSKSPQTVFDHQVELISHRLNRAESPKRDLLLAFELS